MTLPQITDRLFSCAAEAQRADDSRRTELVEEALTLSCDFLSRLYHDIEDYIFQTMKECDLNPEGTSLSPAVLASRNAKFEMFSDRDELRNFLNATGDLLKAGGKMDEELIIDLKRSILFSFEDLKDEPVRSDEFFKNFLILKAICCGSPGSGPGGGPRPTPTGGGGSGWAKADKALDIFAKLAGIAALVVALLDSPKINVPPHQPPPPAAPGHIRLLILLLLSITGRQASGLGNLPAEIRDILDSGGSAKKIASLLKEYMKVAVVVKETDTAFA